MQSGLGVLDIEFCLGATVATTFKRHKFYQKWSDKVRFEIRKYAGIYGSTAAERMSCQRETIE